MLLFFFLLLHPFAVMLFSTADCFVAELMAQTASSSATGSLHARQKLQSLASWICAAIDCSCMLVPCCANCPSFLLMAGEPSHSVKIGIHFHSQPFLSANKALAKSGFAASDFWYHDAFCTGVLPLLCNLDTYSFFWSDLPLMCNIYIYIFRIISTYTHMCIHTYIHTLHYITLHYITLHYITLHYITLHYITLHYITLHYITLHYITLHYITLHYIHTYIHVRISILCLLKQSSHSHRKSSKIASESRGQGHQGHHGHSRPLASAWVSVCGARMRGSQSMTGRRSKNGGFKHRLKFESQILII